LSEARLATCSGDIMARKKQYGSILGKHCTRHREKDEKVGRTRRRSFFIPGTERRTRCRSALEAINLDQIRSNGYIFQVDMCYIAESLNLRMLEVPIYFEDRRVGTRKMTSLVKIEAALRVFEIRWRNRKLAIYGMKAPYGGGEPPNLQKVQNSSVRRNKCCPAEIAEPGIAGESTACDPESAKLRRQPTTGRGKLSDDRQINS